MTKKHYDLIVIGSGPAGEKGAAQAAYFGKSVALVEKEDSLGGAAANTGTLPSKTLRESALYLSGFRQRGLYGITFGLKDKVTARDFLYRERLVVQSEHARIADNIQRHKVQLYKGTCSFVDAKTVAVKPRNSNSTPVELTADNILIATGSYPFHPPNVPFFDARVYDSDTVLNLHNIPKTMLVAGGGVIGCEYACMFSALGIEVSLVEGRERLLGFADQEIAETLSRCMQDMGIKLYLGEVIESVETAELLNVKLSSGKILQVENLLAATGRSGNTGDLNLANVGIDCDNRGNIAVNDNYQTAVPHIYAVGDVIGFPALASTSMEQARIAMVHAFDLKYKTGLAHILPYGIYTIPECSMAGESEDSLQAAKTPYVVGRANYSANARGQIIGDDDGFIKLLFATDDMRLLGVHIIGEQASELVHIGLAALLTGEGADLFINTCYNYPTLSEMYKYATYDALGKRAAMEKAGKD